MESENTKVLQDAKLISSKTGVYQTTRELTKTEKQLRHSAMLALRRNKSSNKLDEFMKKYNLTHDCIAIGKARNGKLGPVLTDKGFRIYFQTIVREKAHWNKRYTNDVKKYDITEPIKTIWVKASHTINSLDAASKISKYTGINHSTIYRLRRVNDNQGRKGTRHQAHLKGLEVTDIRTLLLLAAYDPKRKFTNNWNEGVDKYKYGVFLYFAMNKFHFDPKLFKAKVADIFSSINTIADLARRTGLRRLKLERINPYTRLGRKYDIWQLHPLVISAMLNEYDRLVELGRIIPKSSQK